MKYMKIIIRLNKKRSELNLIQNVFYVCYFLTRFNPLATPWAVNFPSLSIKLLFFRFVASFLFVINRYSKSMEGILDSLNTWKLELFFPLSEEGIPFVISSCIMFCIRLSSAVLLELWM